MSSSSPSPSSSSTCPGHVTRGMDSSVAFPVRSHHQQVVDHEPRTTPSHESVHHQLHQSMTATPAQPPHVTSSNTNGRSTTTAPPAATAAPPAASSQANKCLNEKRRREQENSYIEELAELIADRLSSGSAPNLSVKPDKCAILQEAVRQMRVIRRESRRVPSMTKDSDPRTPSGHEDCVNGEGDGLLFNENSRSSVFADDEDRQPNLHPHFNHQHFNHSPHDVQAPSVSTSKSSLVATEILGPMLLDALDGFVFVVDQDGVIEFVSENVHSFLNYDSLEMEGRTIYSFLEPGDESRFSFNLREGLTRGPVTGAEMQDSSSTHPPLSVLLMLGPPSSPSDTSNNQSNDMTTTALNSPAVPQSRTFNARLRIKSVVGRSSHKSEPVPSRPSCRKDELIGNKGSLALMTPGRKLRSTDEKADGEAEDSLFEECVANGYVGSSCRTVVNDVTGLVYENMQISTLNRATRSEDGTGSLVCVARRMPLTQRCSSQISVQQFSTRLDLSGKVLWIDASTLSSPYSRLLNPELIGHSFLEVCHPNDVQRLQHHLLRTLTSSGDCFLTSPVYRILVSSDRAVCVQTKSRLFFGPVTLTSSSDSPPSPTDVEVIASASSSQRRQAEYIMSTHSIIQDSESMSTSTMVPISSPRKQAEPTIGTQSGVKCESPRTPSSDSSTSTRVPLSRGASTESSAQDVDLLSCLGTEDWDCNMSYQSVPSSGHEKDAGIKRKTSSSSCEYSCMKRQFSPSSVPVVSLDSPEQEHEAKQLAGANPMLASMLAQAPKSSPVLPPLIPTTILSVVPQERLPKNLEQKLVQTSSPPAAEQSFAPQVRRQSHSLMSQELSSDSDLLSDILDQVYTMETEKRSLTSSQAQAPLPSFLPVNSPHVLSTHSPHVSSQNIVPPSNVPHVINHMPSHPPVLPSHSGPDASSQICEITRQLMSCESGVPQIPHQSTSPSHSVHVRNVAGHPIGQHVGYAVSTEQAACPPFPQHFTSPYSPSCHIIQTPVSPSLGVRVVEEERMNHVPLVNNNQNQSSFPVDVEASM